MLNYQGRATSSGSPVNGVAYFKFALISGTSGGPTYWSNDGTSANGSEPTAAVALQVTKGLYSVRLGDTTIPNMSVPITATTLTQSGVWLRVWFSLQQAGPYSLLDPDQRVTAVAYALVADRAANAWAMDGNANATSASFLGTTTATPVTFKVNNTRALELDYHERGPNILGGHPQNTIGAGVYGATLSGGGGDVHGPPHPLRLNAALSHFSTISGGAGNTIGSTVNPFQGELSTIGGGFLNSILGPNDVIGGGSGNYIFGGSTVIGGGGGNRIENFAQYAVISGGENNATEAWDSVIGGGQENRVGLGALHSTIGGGYNNQIAAGSTNITIAGGARHTVDFEAPSGTIGGGSSNQIPYRVEAATIPGGIGAQAFAYGQMAYASGFFEIPGDAQSSLFVLRRQGAGELFLDGVSKRVRMPYNAMWVFSLRVIGVGGRNLTFATVAFEFKGVIRGLSTDAGFEGTPIKTELARSYFWMDWDVRLEVAVNEEGYAELKIIASGENTDTSRWVADLRVLQVIEKLD